MARAKAIMPAAASTAKVDVRDGERFRFFLNMPVASRIRWSQLYPTPRALRTAIDNAIRVNQAQA